MLRGLEARHEQAPQHLLRDTRTMGRRISDFLKNPTNSAITLATLAAGAYVLSGLADIFFLISLGIFIYTVTRKLTLPFRMPLRANLKDFNDLIPGTQTPRKSAGICFFGNDLKTNEELWFNNEDMRTHVLIFGSTGSGKTEVLVSLAFNALIHGSGFIYVDGKGDNSLFAKIFSMARYMGREDDVLLINFMTGAKDIVGPQERRISNTMNPFSNGSSSMLAQMVISLMDGASASPDGDMWKGRAISFVEALMKILVYMRDKEYILLDANTVRNYFALDRLEMMVLDKQFYRENQESVSLEDVPSVVLEPIGNYMTNLPGFNKANKGKQVSQVWEQHGFITMQLTKVFTSLADTYGHIMRTNLAEVDLRDVVLNRRILVVLLPALEKSPDELSSLGKVIIATLKAMMASGLGEQVEGEYREIVQRKPTNAPTPFICILDEYGYYAVKGFAVVPAQARSLGFCAIFAGQDLPAFQKASKEEAASIGANTNIKICMKLEDPTETWDFFSKTASEAYVTKVDSFQTQQQSVLNNYLDTRSASTEKRARIDLLDLKDQREGEAHIFFKSRIIRARMFYANPTPVKYMRLNQLLKVEPPPSRVLRDLAKRLGSFQTAIKTQSYLSADLMVGPSEDIRFLADTLHENDYLDPIERGVTTLLAYHGRNQPVTLPSVEDEVSQEELNLFTKIRLSSYTSEYIVTDNFEQFGAPMLNKSDTRHQLEVVEKLSGRLESYAQSVAMEIVNDMQLATHYPPFILNRPEVTDIVAITDQLIAHIAEARRIAEATPS